MKDSDNHINNARILVCIPSYNVAKEIGSIISRAKKYANEVIVCDDGSIYRTADFAKNI